MAIYVQRQLGKTGKALQLIETSQSDAHAIAGVDRKIADGRVDRQIVKRDVGHLWRQVLECSDRIHQ